jgi:hypothetical protein
MMFDADPVRIFDLMREGGAIGVALRRPAVSDCVEAWN